MNKPNSLPQTLHDFLSRNEKYNLYLADYLLSGLIPLQENTLFPLRKIHDNQEIPLLIGQRGSHYYFLQDVDSKERDPTLLQNIKQRVFLTPHVSLFTPQSIENLFLESEPRLAFETHSIFDLFEYPSPLTPLTPSLDKEFQIVALSRKDLPQLIPLEQAYLQEEVYDGKQLPKQQVLALLHRQLQRYPLFGVRRKREFVAKIGLNAIGLLYSQIGGVYTDKRYRRRGLAIALMRRMLLHLESQGRKNVLFVKRDNHSAKTLYRSLGYQPLDTLLSLKKAEFK